MVKHSDYYWEISQKGNMKKIFVLILLISAEILAQGPAFYPSEIWRISGYGTGFNVEVHDINNDGKGDIIVGNWNNTSVYYGGVTLLDSTIDIVYTGRCLAVCDYNGDGYKDLITMHYTSYDSSRFDYNGEILFYYGSNSTPNIDTIAEYSIPLPTLYPTRDGFSLGYFRTGVAYGDFNNDQKEDIVITSADYPWQGQYGCVYIFMGNNIPPDSATFKVYGEYIPNVQYTCYFGQYFQIGKFNGDNYDDLLLSSRVQTLPPGSHDSLDVLHIYLGGDNFAFVENGESFRYESRLKNDSYSYGWFKREFSLVDLNGDGFGDLIIDHRLKDSTDHVHYGSINPLDTIPSFYLTDIDTTREDVVIGGLCDGIGDWNNDGYNDFLSYQAAIKSFSVNLGGPYISNDNPYGMRGLLEAHAEFPSKAIYCDDQNGDGVKDYVVNANPYHQNYRGYIIIFAGNDHIVTGADEQNKEIKPSNFILFQNYPNPFNSVTIINYQLKINSYVTLKIYDILGKEITTLINEEQTIGRHRIKFNAAEYKLSSGIYIYKLKTEGGELTRKMTYLK